MRVPNPWIALPSLVAGALAAWVGYVVTDVSCRERNPDGVVESCTGLAIGVAGVSSVVAVLGVAVVLVLVYRSIAEYRELEERRRINPAD